MYIGTDWLIINLYTQGLIQDYYEEGGYCYGSQRDTHSPRGCLGASPQKVLKALRLNLEPSESKYHSYNSLSLVRPEPLKMGPQDYSSLLSQSI